MGRGGLLWTGRLEIRAICVDSCLSLMTTESLVDV